MNMESNCDIKDSVGNKKDLWFNHQWTMRPRAIHHRQSALCMALACQYAQHVDPRMHHC
jgi:hypothetical protein